MKGVPYDVLLLLVLLFFMFTAAVIYNLGKLWLIIWAVLKTMGVL